MAIGLAFLTASITAPGASASIKVQKGRFAIALSGTFVATVAVERSIDGGSTFRAVQSFSNADAPTVQVGEEVNSDGALYRFNCTAYTSGTAVAELDQ